MNIFEEYAGADIATIGTYEEFVSWMHEGYIRSPDVAALRHIEAGNYDLGRMTDDDVAIATRIGVKTWNGWAGRLADELEERASADINQQ